MKPTRTQKTSLPALLFPFLPVLFFLLAAGPAAAQTPVTAVFAHTVKATTGNAYSGTGAIGNYPSGLNLNHYNYAFGTTATTSNNISMLDSFTAVGMNFIFAASTTVKFRRADNAQAVGLRKSIWFEQNSATTVVSGGTVLLRPPYDDSLERIFSSGQILNIGLDNNFQNANTTNDNNIERVDHIISSGVTAPDNTKAGFTVFDRGTGGTHDPFYVAAIKTVDAGGNPLTYYNAVHVTAANYGSNVVASIPYIILRKNPADANLLMMNNSSSQNRDGVFLRFADLGVTNGATIYGYSLFPDDLTSTAAANLLDYTNTTYFPTNSDFTSGGLDQVAVTGLWVTHASFVVLPDRVNSFSAHLTGGKVQLDWALGTAGDVAELVVERSGDGLNYSPLLQFNAPLDAQQTAVDEAPYPGQDFYRLKLVDFRGVELAYSPVSRVVLAAQTGIRLTVNPNPVINHQLTFTAAGLTVNSYTLRVVDMGGHGVAEQKFTGGTAFSGSLSLPATLPVGIYTVRLLDKSGNLVCQSLVEMAY